MGRGMKDSRSKLSRRSLIHAVAAPALLGWAMAPLKRARAFGTGLVSQAMAADSDPSMLLVAGPGDGKLAHWASLLCPLLGPALAAGGNLNFTTVGAADGVTAANQFGTRVSPDGSTAMLLPGSAVIAQMAGDPRARFDPGTWVAGLAGLSSTLIISKQPLAQLAGKNPLRVLAADPAGNDLPTLLGLSLLGFNVLPVSPASYGSVTPSAAEHANADVVTLSEASITQSLRWRLSGFTPAFSFGMIAKDGSEEPDPSFPWVPTLYQLLSEKGIDVTRPLPRAQRAAARAKQLSLALVLPQLTPASRIAQWRQACTQSIASLTVQAVAATESLRLVAQPAAVVAIASIIANADAQLELHQWLANRLDWHPV